MVVTITVKEWDENFAVPVYDFMRELSDALGRVPDEFRSEAIIEFDRIGDDYDYSRGELSLHYSRPETESEKRAREQQRERLAREYENRERLEFERLKAKFG